MVNLLLLHTYRRSPECGRWKRVKMTTQRISDRLSPNQSTLHGVSRNH